MRKTRLTGGRITAAVEPIGRGVMRRRQFRGGIIFTSGQMCRKRKKVFCSSACCLDASSHCTTFRTLFGHLEGPQDPNPSQRSRHAGTQPTTTKYHFSGTKYREPDPCIYLTDNLSAMTGITARQNNGGHCTCPRRALVEILRIGGQMRRMGCVAHTPW